MTNIEKRFADFLRKHIILIAFILIAAIGLYIRISLFDTQTADFYFFIKSWIDQLGVNSGLSGLAKEIGEYNIPYMLFLTIVSHTPLTDLYEVKAFSVLFDYVMTIAIIVIISHIRKTKFLTTGNLLIGAIGMLSPIFFLNSAYWSQCDALYTSMLLFCMYFMIKEKHWIAMVFFGIAFTFKLQALFFLPVILIYYFASKKMKAVSLLMIPLVYFISILPAVFAGRSFSSILGIYAKQTDLYHDLTMYCPNIFVFLPGEYDVLKTMGIFMTLGILGIGATVLIHRGFNTSPTTKNQLPLISLWCSMVCIYFLPGMHERYAFIVCVFSLIYAFTVRKDWWIALGINLVSLLSYPPYLFKQTVVDLNYLAFFNFILLIAITYRLFFSDRKKDITTDIKKIQINSET